MHPNTFHNCCFAIINAASRKPQAANIQFAASYAKAGLQMANATNHDEASHEVRVQCLYIVANLSGWRGDEARAVRQALKSIGGIK